MRPLPAAVPGRALVPVVVLLVVAACSAPAAATQTASPDTTACGPARNAAPSGWPQAAEEVVPILVSREITVGPNRFLVSLANEQNDVIASPDVPVELAFHDLTTAPDRAVSSSEAAFLWSLEGELGLYRAQVEFPCSGPWGVEVTATLPDGPQTARVVFDVAPRGTTPSIGAAAPSVETPTAMDEATAGTISTDEDPDLDFYRVSLDDALARQQPVLLVFATPAFCQTRVCGPTLDTVKRAVGDYRDEVALVHVEPYELTTVDGALQPALADGQLQLAPAAEAYGLPVEPYVFVIDREGRVAGKFEGVAGEDELRAALDRVLGDA